MNTSAQVQERLANGTKNTQKLRKVGIVWGYGGNPPFFGLVSVVSEISVKFTTTTHGFCLYNAGISQVDFLTANKTTRAKKNANFSARFRGPKVIFFKKN